MSQQPLTVFSFLWALLWSFPYSLWVSVVNDMADMESETDLHNTFKGGISGPKILSSEKRSLIFLQWLSFFVIVVPILLTLNLWYWMAASITLLIPYLYSIPPFRLKERPPLDSLSNGLVAVSMLLTGFFVNGWASISGSLLRGCLALAIGVSALHILAALRDYFPDRKTHTRTLAVVFGQRISALICMLCFLLAIWLVRDFPTEFILTAFTGLALSTFLFVWPSEKKSFTAVIILMMSFFLAMCISLVFSTWRLIV